MNRNISATLLLVIVAGASVCSAAESSGRRPNVLLIISDDMRAELGSYGVARAQTPNIDALAKSGVRFDRAYCQFPLCNPSRSSMLTGRYPSHTGVLGNRTWFRNEHPELVSLPQLFQQAGYVTLRSGKIFHGGIDDTDAWTEGGERRRFGAVAPTIQQGSPARRERQEASRRRAPQDGRSKNERSDRWVVLSGDAKNHGDYRSTDRAIEHLQKHAESEQPFFLALGLAKPHSPPEAPLKFYDLYPLSKIELPVDFAPRPTVPEGFPRGSIRRRNADLFIGRDASEQDAREFTRAYLASVSYVDSNVGRVLDELDRLNLEDDTIVVFWTDHGYQLGEKGKWSKAGSLWEQCARTPLIVRLPGNKHNGQSVTVPVEAIDILPTLAELAGIAPPADIDGRSLVPLLNDPQANWDYPAFTVWSEDGQNLTGIVVRSGQWRYAEFTEGGPMLIDFENDPHELKNLAGDSAHAAIEAKLAALVKEYRKRVGAAAVNDADRQAIEATSAALGSKRS